MKKWYLIFIFFFVVSCGPAIVNEQSQPETLSGNIVNGYPISSYPGINEPGNVMGPEFISDDPATFEGLLAFHSSRNGSLQLYVLNGQTGITELVQTGSAQSYEPVWSSDCQTLLYAHEVAAPRDSEIHTVTVGQSNTNQLLVNPRLETIEWAPAWSTDNQHIAFQTNPQAKMNVCLANINGEEQGCLTQENYSNAHPSWSLNNNSLLFISDRDGDWDIYKHDLLNNQELQITQNNGVDFHPHYSPDQTKIIFQSDRIGNFDIYVMNADGTGERQLTFHEKDDVEPRWVGKDKIVFSSFRDEDWELYFYDLIDNALTRITYVPGDDKGPAWCLPSE